MYLVRLPFSKIITRIKYKRFALHVYDILFSFEQLEHHDKNVNKRELRTEEEMAKEAAELRSYFT